MAEINTDQNYPLVLLSITDAQGRTARVDGVPVWTSSNEAVLRVTPAADGLSAVVDTVDIGTARINVSADADLGTGVTPITGASEDVNVSQGPSTVATSLGLNLGAPANKV
jgi:hypothetical protein